MKHKHYDCIVAWAEGKTIEHRCIGGEVWYDSVDPIWSDNYEYRIKKEPVIEVKYFYKTCGGDYKLQLNDSDWQLKITYQDGVAIKAEVAE